MNSFLNQSIITIYLLLWQKTCMTTLILQKNNLDHILPHTLISNGIYDMRVGLVVLFVVFIILLVMACQRRFEIKRDNPWIRPVSKKLYIVCKQHICRLLCATLSFVYILVCSCWFSSHSPGTYLLYMDWDYNQGWFSRQTHRSFALIQIKYSYRVLCLLFMRAFVCAYVL